MEEYGMPRRFPGLCPVRQNSMRLRGLTRIYRQDIRGNTKRGDLADSGKKSQKMIDNKVSMC